MTSSDVNAYLRQITGRDVTAKDFRTWAGSVLAALALQEFEKFDSQAQHKKKVRAAIENVAARLGNTPAICRKCYVHPEILNSYAEGALLVQVKDRVDAELRDDLAMLKPEEAAVLTLLEFRLGRDLKIALKESAGRPNLVHIKTRPLFHADPNNYGVGGELTEPFSLAAFIMDDHLSHGI